MWKAQPPDNAEQCIASWLGHARQADSAALIRALQSRFELPFPRSGKLISPNSLLRVVQ